MPGAIYELDALGWISRLVHIAQLAAGFPPQRHPTRHCHDTCCAWHCGTLPCLRSRRPASTPIPLSLSSVGTMAFSLRLPSVSLLLLASLARALQVAPGSQCAPVCLDQTGGNGLDPNASTTGVSNIICNDADYSTSAVGVKFKSCMECLQSSTAVSGTETDLGWFLCECLRGPAQRRALADVFRQPPVCRGYLRLRLSQLDRGGLFPLRPRRDLRSSQECASGWESGARH